ncbi:hypothetical protein M436DRAFT_79691 [Aureobasidium namibiae CBS 147.97]|uniref:Extracellular membrane protein CFEM domain-containing protein n=1 Tax=Aureobasidium namibiae CBS 147.97 TaxID=1043004 RepID=A0A074XL34_9PEZI
MFTKNIAVFAALALSIQIAVAAPPACVLQAVNQPANSPADVKSICVNGSTVEQTLVSDCGNDYDAAMSAFSSICAGVSVTIAPWTMASSSASQETQNALTIAGGSTIPFSTTSGAQSSSASISTSASVSGSESAATSTGTTVVTATGPILTATNTVTSTQTGPPSSGTTSTGAAEHVENSGLFMGAMAAAGLVMAL